MAITSYDVNWNGHTGQEVQDFISGELQAIRTNANKAIEKIEFIQDDELVEVTPHHIRLRKRILNTVDRKKFDARQN